MGGWEMGLQPLEELGSGVEEVEVEGGVFFFLLRQAPIRDLWRKREREIGWFEI